MSLIYRIIEIPVLSMAFERRNEPSGLSLKPLTVSVCPGIV